MENAINTQVDKPDFANVFRYIRPIEFFDFEEYGDFTNLYGITINYLIDYKTGVVDAGWSVCNGDNFDKKIGRKLAEETSKVFTFLLSDVDKYEGLTNALVANITEGHWDRVPTYFDDTLEIFLKASRNM